MRQELKLKGKTIGNGKPLVCVPIMAKTGSGILDEATRLVEAGVDLIEWRLDAYEEVEEGEAVLSLLKQLKPMMRETLLLATFRSAKQGGLRELPEEVLDDLHLKLAESGSVDLIDIEYFADLHADEKIDRIHGYGAHVITSQHNFEETPSYEEIAMTLRTMEKSNTDIVKFAVMPQNRGDVLRMLQATVDFQEEYPTTPIVTMSMGGLGTCSRMIGEFSGSCITFGAGTVASAPGQLPMGELKEALEILHRGMSL